MNRKFLALLIVFSIGMASFIGTEAEDFGVKAKIFCSRRFKCAFTGSNKEVCATYQTRQGSIATVTFPNEGCLARAECEDDRFKLCHYGVCNPSKSKFCLKMASPAELSSECQDQPDDS